MGIAIGFVIAFAVGLTGIGGGTLAVPALVLLVGIPAGEAIGTAMVFAAVIKLLAAPLFVRAGHVNQRALKLMLYGAAPGLVLGGVLLFFLSRAAWIPAILLATGLLVVIAGGASLWPRPVAIEARDRSRWLPWLSVPLGVEIGFSAVGAGSLGTLLLLHCSPLAPAEVIGTDLIFGLVIIGAGAVMHSSLGLVNLHSLWPLLLGGLPGVWLGVKAVGKLPQKRLRLILSLVLIVAGAELFAVGWRQRSASLSGAGRSAARPRARHCLARAAGRVPLRLAPAWGPRSPKSGAAPSLRPVIIPAAALSSPGIQAGRHPVA